MSNPGTAEAPRFNKEMRRRREALHLSQREAASLAGLSDARWRQLEHDTPTKTTVITVRKIAAVLDWDLIEALLSAGFTPDPETPAGVPVIPVQLAPSLEAIVAGIRQLQPRDQRVVAGLVASMRNPHAELDVAA